MSQIHTCFTLRTWGAIGVSTAFNSFTRLHVSKEAHVSHAVTELLSRPSSAEDKSNPIALLTIPPLEGVFLGEGMNANGMGLSW